MSSNSIAAMEAIVEYFEIEKGESFIKKNQNNSKEYFVIEGICRSYINDTEGQEITITFFCQNSIISPYLSRTTKGKSDLNFQALTHMKLGAMNASEFENLMVENLEIREFGNTVLRNELKQKVEKEIDLASSTASERLLKFRKKYPLLENLIPHQAIATYLGITNISLSRLRRELMD